MERIRITSSHSVVRENLHGASSTLNWKYGPIPFSHHHKCKHEEASWNFIPVNDSKTCIDHSMSPSAKQAFRFSLHYRPICWIHLIPQKKLPANQIIPYDILKILFHNCSQRQIILIMVISEKPRLSGASTSSMAPAAGPHWINIRT